MNKLYNRIIWENDTTPALNEDNLNAMSKGIDDIDDRVLDLGVAVLEVIPDLQDMLSNATQLKEYRDDAVAAATSAEGDASNAEAWADGTRDGTPVGPTDPAYHNNAKYWSEQANPTAFANMTDVDFNNLQNGQVPVWNSTAQKWENGSGGGGGTASQVSYDNTTSGLTATNVQDAIDEVEGRVDTAENDISALENGIATTTLAVDLTSWTTDTTSQSGTTLYKKSVSLSHVYASPSVDIGAGTGYVLPTSAEQESYNLLQYVTVDDAVPCLYLYASDIPTTAFYIKVKGVD